jgi:hypothetical protein
MLSARDLLNAKLDMRITYILLVKARADCARCGCACAGVPPPLLWTRENTDEMAARAHDAGMALAAAKAEKTALRAKYETLRLVVDKHRKYTPAVMEEIHEIERANGQDLMAYIMHSVEKLSIVYTSLMSSPEIAELASMHAFIPLWRRMYQVYNERLEELLRAHENAQGGERERVTFVRMLNRYNRKIAMYEGMLTRLERDTRRTCRAQQVTETQFNDLVDEVGQPGGVSYARTSSDNG